jgi:inner membrane protein
MSRAGLNRKTALATATMTLAAEAADLDVLGNLKNPIFGFAHHRGFTHSFLGAVLVAALVVGFMYLVWRLRGRKTKDPNLPPRWGLLFLFAYLAAVSHVLLDFTNNYGVRPFWPFSEKWHSWDIVFIVDPLILILLTAGLVLPGLFRLINEEIGVRRKGPQGRLAATLALLALVGLWGLRDYEHRHAVSALEARMYRDADPIRVSAFPNMMNPFRWRGVVETEDFYATMVVDSATPEVDPANRMRFYYKPKQTAATLAAKKSYMGRVFLDWAQYPLTEAEQLSPPQEGYVVRFWDLRFGDPGPRGRTPLSGSVELDRNLHVISENFGFRRGRRQP